MMFCLLEYSKLHLSYVHLISQALILHTILNNSHQRSFAYNGYNQRMSQIGAYILNAVYTYRISYLLPFYNKVQAVYDSLHLFTEAIHFVTEVVLQGHWRQEQGHIHVHPNIVSTAHYTSSVRSFAT